LTFFQSLWKRFFFFVAIFCVFLDAFFDDFGFFLRLFKFFKKGKPVNGLDGV